jgi:hypothetical protein
MDTLPAARSNRDEMGEQESRVDVYLTSRENREAQRNNKECTPEVSLGRCGRSILSLE